MWEGGEEFWGQEGVFRHSVDVVNPGGGIAGTMGEAERSV